MSGRIGLIRGPYAVYFWGKNLTNEKYYEDYNPAKFSGGGSDIGWLAEPRSYGVELKASF